MLGRAAGRHGSCCGGPPGPDCADFYKGKKAQRAHEKREWQREEQQEMPWRSVSNINLVSSPGAKELHEFLTDRNYHAEAKLEGSWLVFRIYEKEDSPPHEYAVPASAVHYVSFYPQEPEG